MSARESFLDNHVRLLLENEENFRRYWSELAERERQGVLLLASEIDQCGSRELNIIAGHARASRELARYMVRIQERDFDYLRIPRDWLDFVHSDSEKIYVYQQVERLLQGFLEREKLRSSVMLYGGVKPEASLLRRMMSSKTDDQFRRQLLDTWDIVRFRIVADNIVTARHAAMRVWECFFDEVVRCRNYYFRPRDDDHQDPYRGIHFELELLRGRIIELQVLTKIREVVGLFDHAATFKKSLQLPSADHQAWLFFFERKANLLEAQSII